MHAQYCTIGWTRAVVAAVTLFALVEHARSQPNVAGRADNNRTATAALERQANAVVSLRSRLIALSPRVRLDEAERAARCAHETSRRLGREYGIVGWPGFHNFLVNAGLKKRGLCHQWARDLMAGLAVLKLTTLELHWGTALAGTRREHSCVVITAKGRPFTEGIVLDSWRHSGRLYSGPVTTDRYPWKEDLADCLCARRRARSVTSRSHVPGQTTNPGRPPAFAFNVGR